MPEDSSQAQTRLAEMQRDEALRTLAAVRGELTQALKEHRANELHLATEIREAQRQLAQARDTIAHMKRSLFWRARVWVMRLRRRSSD